MTGRASGRRRCPSDRWSRYGPQLLTIRPSSRYPIRSSSGFDRDRRMDHPSGVGDQQPSAAQLPRSAVTITVAGVLAHTRTR
jgi:hypothetical protein